PLPSCCLWPSSPPWCAASCAPAATCTSADSRGDARLTMVNTLTHSHTHTLTLTHSHSHTLTLTLFCVGPFFPLYLNPFIQSLLLLLNTQIITSPNMRKSPKSMYTHTHT